MSENRNDDQEGLGLLWGAAEIAPELGLNLEQTKLLLRKRRIPARKIGHKWVITREDLRRFFRSAA